MRNAVVYSADTAAQIEQTGLQTRQNSYVRPHAYGAFPVLLQSAGFGAQLYECRFEADIQPRSESPSYGPVRLLDRNGAAIGTPDTADAGQVIAHMPLLAREPVEEGQYGIVQYVAQYANCGTGQSPPSCHTGWIITHAECPDSDPTEPCVQCLRIYDSTEGGTGLSDDEVWECITFTNKGPDGPQVDMSSQDVAVELSASISWDTTGSGGNTLWMALGTSPNWAREPIFGNPSEAGGRIYLQWFFRQDEPEFADNELWLGFSSTEFGEEIFVADAGSGVGIDATTTIKLSATKVPATASDYDISATWQIGGTDTPIVFTPLLGGDPATVITREAFFYDPLWWSVFPHTGDLLTDFTAAVVMVEPCSASGTINILETA
jgi:hypothetical protein